MGAKEPRRHLPDIRPRRLPAEAIARNFADIAPPLSRSEALIEADRCYFCFDAPCTNACPTEIDIPGFIQKIRSDNIRGSARTILSQNIMGGMCARVCPTEVLCEDACVRNTHEDQPVRIGLLQRYATDPVFAAGVRLFERAPDSGFRVAVVGAGPAGLACAHRLAMHGHSVVVFNRDAKAGGLNEYGIAAYKTVDDFAQREVGYILSIGGIEIRNGVALGRDVALAELQSNFDAVFLGAGLCGVNRLGVPGEELDGVLNAVDFIAELRQTRDKGALPVGNRLVVIGGGMTAIDIAVQTKRLGAECVDIVYRRGPEDMGASRHEQELAQTSGVRIRHWSKPVRFFGNGHVAGVEFERTRRAPDGLLEGTGETWSLEADTVFRAVGQRTGNDFAAALGEGFEREGGKLVIDGRRRTSVAGIWAGGDCTAGSADLTVTAVQDGKRAALDIDRWLRSAKRGNETWQT